MTVERLPNIPSTPLYFLHKLLESVDQIESIVAVIKWDNKTYQCCWTSQELSSLAMSSVCAQDMIRREIVETENGK